MHSDRVTRVVSTAHGVVWSTDLVDTPAMPGRESTAACMCSGLMRVKANHRIVVSAKNCCSNKRWNCTSDEARYHFIPGETPSATVLPRVVVRKIRSS